jgi:Mn-dependent DtxR family transcriptional regulator
MGVLRGLGYIAIDDKHCISLTDQGLIKAQAIYERHKIITAFLVQLGVDAATAERDACRIEHDISQQTFECIKLATNIQ